MYGVYVLCGVGKREHEMIYTGRYVEKRSRAKVQAHKVMHGRAGSRSNSNIIIVRMRSRHASGKVAESRYDRGHGEWKEGEIGIERKKKRERKNSLISDGLVR